MKTQTHNQGSYTLTTYTRISSQTQAESGDLNVQKRRCHDFFYDMVAIFRKYEREQHRESCRNAYRARMNKTGTGKKGVMRGAAT